MRTLRLLLLSSAVALSACGDRGTLYTDAIKPLPLVAAQNALVEVVPETARAVVIAADGSARSVGISPGARYAAAVPGGAEVAIIGGSAKEPVLDLLAVDDAKVQSLPMPGSFDTIAFDPSGRVGLLTYATTTRPSELVARNPNEVGVADFLAGTLLRMQLDTDNAAPKAVIYTPEGGGRLLCAVLFDKGVAVLDPLKPSVAPRRISVRSRDGLSDATLVEALFSPDGHYLYLRASTIDDVIVVELGEDAKTGGLAASVNFVSGGTGLADIDVPQTDALPHAVFALYTGSREAVLLDARGVEDLAVHLPLETALTRLTALPGGRVLAYDGAKKSVVAWDPVQQKSGQTVLDSTFDAALPTGGLGKVVFRHPGAKNGAGAALSVVSIDEDVNRLRTHIRAIQLASAAAATTFDAQGTRLFFTTSGTSALVRLDLDTLELGQVTLDAPAAQLLFLAGKDTVAAIHGGNPFGDATLLPASNLERPAAVRVTDFALAGELDRPAEEER